MTRAPALRQLQRWFTAIVEHPSTAAVALRSHAANTLVPARDIAAGNVIAANARMSAVAMLDVYNGGYLERLVEVLRGDFGAVQHLLGEHAFRALAARYVARHPSRHPNLNRLGRHLPAFVRSRRALRRRAFLAELATLELAVCVAFGAPEFTPVASGALDRVPQQSWEHARLTPNPSLQLFAFRFPVDVFYQAWKDGKPVPVPRPEPSFLLVFRKHDRVWRQRLARSAHAMLRDLVAGRTLAAALGKVAAGDPVAQWFQGFARDGLFTAIDLTKRGR